MPAKNELGKLFIDFQGLGLGELTKGLSGLNVGLGTATKTAEKLIASLNPKKGGSSFRDLADDAKFLNMTLADTYNMKIRALKAGLPEDSFINALKEAQIAIKDLQFDSKFNVMLSRIGVDIRDLMEEKNPLRYMRLIVDALNQAVVAGDEVNARYFAMQLGVYDVWKRQNELLGKEEESERVSEKKLDNLVEQERQYNLINAHLTQTQDLIKSILGQDFMPFLHWADQKIQRLNVALNSSKGSGDAIKNIAKTKTGKYAGDFLYAAHPFIGAFARGAMNWWESNKVAKPLDGISSTPPSIQRSTNGLLPLSSAIKSNVSVNLGITDKTSNGVEIQMAPSQGLDFGTSNNTNANMNYAEGAL